MSSVGSDDSSVTITKQLVEHTTQTTEHNDSSLSPPSLTLKVYREKISFLCQFGTMFTPPIKTLRKLTRGKNTLYDIMHSKYYLLDLNRFSNYEAPERQFMICTNNERIHE